eukprot:UN11516
MHMMPSSFIFSSSHFWSRSKSIPFFFVENFFKRYLITMPAPRSSKVTAVRSSCSRGKLGESNPSKERFIKFEIRSSFPGDSGGGASFRGCRQEVPLRRELALHQSLEIHRTTRPFAKAVLALR